MEQTGAYKVLSSLLHEAEQDLVNGNYLKKTQGEWNHSVEAEFEKCMTALVAQKQALLDDIETKYQEEVKNKKLRDQLGTAYKETLEAGPITYSVDKAVSVQMLKVSAVKPPVFNYISVKFPSNLVDSITSYGKVDINSSLLFSRAGDVSTLAGSSSGKDDGDGTLAKFADPSFGHFSPVDNCLYVSDYGNHAIRKVTPQGRVTTFAINTKDNLLVYPVGIAVYHKDNSVFVCSQHTIKKISSSGTIHTFAGNNTGASIDGVGTAACFCYPRGIAIDQQTGSIFISDNFTRKIRKITPQGKVTTIAGTGQVGSSDGSGTAATFDNINGICFDEKNDSLLICDTNNNKLRRLDLTSGEVKTVCEVISPTAVALTPNGLPIVTSAHANIVSVITQTSGSVSPKPIAGSGTLGCEDGAPLNCKLSRPWGISVDPNTNTCYVVELGNHKIRKFTLM